MTNNNVYHNERAARIQRARYKEQCRRDNQPCMHCRERILYAAPATEPLSFTIEHLLSRREGGARDDPNNWGPAHRRCNQERGDMTLQQFAAKRQQRLNTSEEWT